MKNKGVQIILWLSIFALLAGMGLTNLIRNIFKRQTTGVASVNGQDIALNEFRRSFLALANFIEQAKKMYGENANLILSLYGIDLKNKNLENFVLDKLVQQKIVDQLASSTGVRIGSDYVKNKLTDVDFVRNYLSDVIPPQAIDGNKLNPELLSLYLERQGITSSEFESLIKDSLSRIFLHDIISKAVYIPTNILKDNYIKQYAKKKFGIGSVDISKYIAIEKGKEVSDAELKNYYDAHKEAYRVNEKRSGKIWLFEARNFGINITENELKDYYDRNKYEFAISDSAKSDKKGAKSDSAKGPETKFKEFSSVKDEIKQKLTNQKFRQAFDSEAHRIISQAKDMPSVFENFIKSKSAGESKLEDVIQDQSKRSKKLFDLENIGDYAYFQDEGRGYIIQLAKIEPSYIPKLEDTKNQVKEDLFKDKAKKTLELDLNKLVKVPTSGLQKDIAKLQGSFEATDWYDPQNAESLKKFKDISGALNSFDQIGQTKVFVNDKNAYLVRLEEIEKINEDDFNQKKDRIKDQLMHNETASVFSSIVNSAKKKAKVQRDENLLRMASSGRYR